ncbi:MAG: glutaredoxin family protein [Tepidiphilus sp.]|nr:glutaredoxin family protein [Tepidiphilus sp.]MDD3432622.1 glutaredoxin family protein [Tepidiphilus sp.]
MSQERVLWVLSRPGCHLCDDMVEALMPIARHYGFIVVKRDVDVDPAWRQRYGRAIPVVLHGSVEICRHRCDAASVHDYLSRFPLE